MRLEGKTRSVLLLQPRGNDYGALLDFFRRHDILGLAVGEAGCISSEVQVPQSGVGPVIVTALWDSAEAYAGWRSHPVRAQFNDEMDSLIEPEASPVASGLYTVAITAAQSDVQ